MNEITKRFSDKEYLDVVHQPEVDIQFAPMSVPANVLFKDFNPTIKETNK